MVSLSYTSIKLLRTDPEAYYRIYLQRIKEPSTLYQIEGNLIHDFLLSPNVVESRYAIIPKVPGSPQMLRYLTKLANLVNSHLALDGEIGEEALSLALQVAHRESGYVESIENVEKKAKEFDTYFRFLLEKDSKICISQQTYDKCREISGKAFDQLDSMMRISFWRNHGLIIPSQARFSAPFFTISMHPDLESIPNVASGERCEVFNELAFNYNFKFNSTRLGIRGIQIFLNGRIDNMVVDHESKTIAINDLKKVANILTFKKDYLDRRLDIQAGMYIKIIKEALKIKFADYKLSFNFLVVDDKARFYPFSLSEKTLGEVLKNIDEEIDICFYHLKKSKFNLPYEYLTKSIQL